MTKTEKTKLSELLCTLSKEKCAREKGWFGNHTCQTDCPFHINGEDTDYCAIDIVEEEVWS